MASILNFDGISYPGSDSMIGFGLLLDFDGTGCGMINLN